MAETITCDNCGRTVAANPRFSDYTDPENIHSWLTVTRDHERVGDFCQVACLVEHYTEAHLEITLSAMDSATPALDELHKKILEHPTSSPDGNAR